jgi:hypothetical protein
MKSTWVEFSMSAAHKELVPSRTPLIEQMGVLLLEKPDGKIRVVGCMKSRVAPPIVIPLIKEIDPETGQSTTTFSEGGRVFFGDGSSDLERAKREVEFAVAGLRHTAIFAARFLTLLNAGRAPIERSEPTPVAEGTRRLMRKNAPSGFTPTYQGMTRIELNRYGADHVDALRDEADVRAGRKVRPHWVRGHLMRTESKGPVWRRAHVRGVGDPVMSTRSAVHTPSPEVGGSEDGPSL